MLEQELGCSLLFCTMLVPPLRSDFVPLLLAAPLACYCCLASLELLFIHLTLTASVFRSVARFEDLKIKSIGENCVERSLPCLGKIKIRYRCAFERNGSGSRASNINGWLEVYAVENAYGAARAPRMMEPQVKGCAATAAAAERRM